MAGVRGTHFRISSEEAITRLETLHGLVALQGEDEEEEQLLPQGKASTVNAKGRYLSDPVDLLSIQGWSSPWTGSSRSASCCSGAR